MYSRVTFKRVLSISKWSFRLPMSGYDAYICQILTTKVDPRSVRIKTEPIEWVHILELIYI